MTGPTMLTAGRIIAPYRGVPIAFGSDAINGSADLTRGQITMRWIDSYATAGIDSGASFAR